MFKNILVIGALGLSLVGCASIPRTAFNKEANKNIKKIAVIEQKDQEKYNVNILAHPGVGFGLIGGIVAAVDMNAKSNRLTTAIDPKETKLQTNFTDLLVKKLEAAGFSVVRSQKKMVEVESTSTAAGPDAVATSGANKVTREEVDPKIYESADAVLLTTINGGFIAAGASSDYFPAVGLDVKLENKEKKALYEEHMMYGFQGAGIFDKFLTFPDSSNTFTNMDTLVQDPAKTRSSLLKGLEKITAQVVKDLSHEGLSPVVPVVVPTVASVSSEPQAAAAPTVTEVKP